jgi:hypothetical protein
MPTPFPAHGRAAASRPPKVSTRIKQRSVTVRERSGKERLLSGEQLGFFRARR